jgi:hypothetical protein
LHLHEVFAVKPASRFCPEKHATKQADGWPLNADSFFQVEPDHIGGRRCRLA